MRTRLATWIDTRSERERRLLAAAFVAAGLVLCLRLGIAVTQDLARTRARIDAQEHDLAAARRLAAELAVRPAETAVREGTPLVTRLEGVAAAVIGRERIASMTPIVGTEAAVALRVVGTSLAETVQMLHGIEGGGDRVQTLDMVKHPDDPGRFDVTLEIAGDDAS